MLLESDFKNGLDDFYIEVLWGVSGISIILSCATLAGGYQCVKSAVLL